MILLREKGHHCLKCTVLHALLALAFLLLAGCRQDAAPDTVKVMSFNIRVSPDDGFDGENSWAVRKEGCIEMIRDVEPDLFGVQEGLCRQVRHLVDNLPEYGSHGIGNEADDTGETNAVFYRKDRFELVDKGTFWLSETPGEASCGWDGAYKRVVSWVRLKDLARGGEVFFFNTHFDHMGKVAREQSGRMVVEAIRSMTGGGDCPVFLVGDFNANHDDHILDPIREYMGMAREDAPTSDALNTYHAWKTIDDNAGGSIIDHIFYRNARPLEYVTWTKGYGLGCISDHYPVYGVFGLHD